MTVSVKHKNHQIQANKKIKALVISGNRYLIPETTK